MDLSRVRPTVRPVGVFLNNPRKFAELRPKDKWVAVSFSLRRRAGHPRITRKVVEYGNRYWHVANIREPSAIDADLLDLLTEAYADEPTWSDRLFEMCQAHLEQARERCR